MICLIDNLKKVDFNWESQKVSLEYVRHMLLHNEFRTNFSNENYRRLVSQDIFRSDSLVNMWEECYSNDVVILCEIGIGFDDSVEYSLINAV
jgi:hypothetical protein